MRKKFLTKWLKWTGATVLFLFIVLVVHIYWVTRPKAPTASTRAMARIDIKQKISNEDANRITTWLYTEKGVDHVLVNPVSSIAVFSFFPLQTNADKVVSDFTAAFHYNAKRYVPSEKELMAGCPVAANSFTYKVSKFVKTIF